jgi:type IV pilus assembly protein PilP
VGKILLSVFVIAALAVAAYVELGPRPLDVRESIETAINQRKEKQPLSKEEENLLRLQLAITNYTIQKNTPPESLAELVPEYFDKVPVDPNTGASFRYKKIGTTPLLGEQIDRYERALAQKSGQTVAEPTKKSESSEKDQQVASVNGEFINPNEMIEDNFVYNAEGKRDPFTPFDLSPKMSGDETLTPLERYTLGQLRLAAVLSSEGEPAAIVEDVQGKGYTVRPGTKIGNAGGVVVSIEQGKLNVLETIVDFAGNETQKVTELVIQTQTDVSAREKAKQQGRRRR